MICTFSCQLDWQVKWQTLHGRTATSFCKKRQKSKQQMVICLSNVVAKEESVQLANEVSTIWSKGA